jgi:magnesium transporter
VEACILENNAPYRTRDMAKIRAAITAGTTTWIDLDKHEPAIDAFLTEALGIHALTLEDIWSDRPAPKVDEFPGYIYVCAQTMRASPPDPPDPSGPPGGSRALAHFELDLVVGRTFVITRDEGRATVLAVHEELARTPKSLVRGPAWIAHSVLDHAVDGYLPVIDAFDDEVESLQDDVLAKAGTREGNAVLARILETKRSLQALRRISIHQRDVLLRLARGEFAILPAEIVPYMRDVHDHFVRVSDLAESYRDLVTSALEAYLSVQSNRLNEVMKTLALISTVMLPLTFIAGVYGMNFDRIPELHWLYGYPYALCLMGVTAIGAVLWFRHKAWI